MKPMTVFTKDVGEVRDKFMPECEVVKTLEDRNEDYIKSELGILE